MSFELCEPGDVEARGDVVPPAPFADAVLECEKYKKSAMMSKSSTNPAINPFTIAALWSSSSFSCS